MCKLDADAYRHTDMYCMTHSNMNTCRLSHFHTYCTMNWNYLFYIDYLPIHKYFSTFNVSVCSDDEQCNGHSLLLLYCMLVYAIYWYANQSRCVWLCSAQVYTDLSCVDWHSHTDTHTYVDANSKHTSTCTRIDLCKIHSRFKLTLQVRNSLGTGIIHDSVITVSWWTCHNLYSNAINILWPLSDIQRW